MRPLIVTDLDHTLLTIDSLRLLVLRHLDAGSALLLARRALGFLGRGGFAAALARRLSPVLGDEQEMERFAARLETDVDEVVLDVLRSRAGADGLILILSASPQAYVERLGRRLGFAGIGSHWQGEQYVHCHGERKRTLLLERFPPERYAYEFAVSDDRSDLGLLSAFREGQLHERSRGRK